MLEKISAAQAKSHFSEILSRVFYAHDQFVIERKGKPVAALVDIDLAKLGRGGKRPKKSGLLRAVGAWKEFKDLDKVVSEIYGRRKVSKDREVRFG